MEENELISEKIQHIKDAILKYVPARYIYLFGSYAYGNATSSSDIDIYAVIPDEAKEDFFLYAKIIRELANIDIYEIDLILKTESKFNYRKTRSLFEKIICEKGKLIHECL